MSNTAAPERGSIDTARAAWSRQRHDETASLRETVRAIVRSGVTTLGAIAKALQDQGVRTPSGASKWHRAQVSRLPADDAAASGSSETAPAAGRKVSKCQHVG
jgi:hypothetical protein